MIHVYLARLGMNPFFFHVCATPLLMSILDVAASGSLVLQLPAAASGSPALQLPGAPQDSGSTSIYSKVITAMAELSVLLCP